MTEIFLKAMQPASDAALAKAIDSLKQSCGQARRSDDQDEAAYNEELKLDRYIAKCRRYPADVALYALWTWDDDHEFFPRWKELRVRLDALVKRRQAVFFALKHYSPTEGEKLAAAEEPVKTEADKAAVREMSRRFVQSMVAKDPALRAKHGVSAGLAIKAPSEKTAFGAAMDDRRETDALEAEQIARERT